VGIPQEMFIYKLTTKSISDIPNRIVEEKYFVYRDKAMQSVNGKIIKVKWEKINARCWVSLRSLFLEHTIDKIKVEGD
jgi:hypothetical protein